MSDPDFLSIVETNRLRKNGSKTQKTTTRARAFMNDSITLCFEDGSTSTVPRFRIDKEFIQSAVNRVTARKAASKPKVFKSKLFSVKESAKESTTKLPFRSPALMFSHLHHRDSNTIIMADADLKTKCSANVTYDVVAMAPIAISGGGVLSVGESRDSKKRLSQVSSHQTESHYEGDVLYIIHDVPITTQNGRFEVTGNDVKIWIVTGAIHALETVDVLTKKIKSLKETLLQIEQELASLPPTPIPGGKGRVTAGSSVKNAREKKVKILSDEKQRCASLMRTAMQSLETLYAQHMNDCKLVVEKRLRDGALDNKSCDWTIQVDGDKMEVYTSLIEKNKNWSMIPMYAFGIKGDKTSISLPIPEGDQSNHFVDIKGITMSKLPHGFGIFESYDEFDPYLNSGKTISRHRLYHGQFHEGEFSEGTLYTEAGIFTGTFNKGHPTIGTKKYADGIEISGEFAVHNLSLQTSTNPYCRGLSNGFQSIKFPDKAKYEGEMKQGRITGKGTYKYAGSELSGEFKDGMLQFDEGNEGQGYSNLHLSCIYGGERLWGP